MQYQFDVAGDGVNDAKDVELLRARPAHGPPQVLATDVNRDGCVDNKDVALVYPGLGQATGMLAYDSDLDVDASGYIDLGDVARVQTASAAGCR